MYVTGRDGSGIGTVLASILQTSRELNVESVTIVARATENEAVVADAALRLNQTIGSKVPVSYIPLKDISLESLCSDHDFDCAIVSTPDHTHFEQISALLRSGIHVLSVKPLVPTVEENRALIELQQNNKLIGMVEFHKRYDEANLYTKRVVTEGQIGRVVHYDVHYTQKIGIPRVTFSSWVRNTNIFQYLGVHYVDLFYFMTGLKPVKAMAYGTEGALSAGGISTWDSVHATVIWKDLEGRESASVFNIGWSDPDCTSAMSDQRYKLIGTSGRIENDHKHRGVEMVTEKTAVQHPNPYFSDFLLDADGNYALSGYGYQSIRQYLLDVATVMSGEVEANSFEGRRPTFKDSLVATSVLESVNHSLNNSSQWEPINESF